MGDDLMIDYEMQDLGIPLPGSDPERRKRIKIEIHRLKPQYYVSPWEYGRIRVKQIQPSTGEVKG
jgi:hypothetical protein